MRTVMNNDNNDEKKRKKGEGGHCELLISDKW